MPIGQVSDYLKQVPLTEMQKSISGPVLKEVYARIGFLIDVGLDYLSLSRAAATLSGGEAQRIRLATQVGSGLVGVAYILDDRVLVFTREITISFFARFFICATWETVSLS